MKRLLLLGALGAAVLVSAAAAAPPATQTLRGTVIAKDRAHKALVVARPGGRVQMLGAPAAFNRTGIGSTVVIRFARVAGELPVALTVSPRGRAQRALVQGTIVRLAKRRAVINAGGSLLKVTLRAPGKQRTLASAQSGPHVGDTIKISVEIDDDGSLDDGAVVATATSAGPEPDSSGEMEVRGKVAAITPSSLTVPGSITVTVMGLPVTCVVPVGVTLDVEIGDPIELECRLVGSPAAWTLRIAKAEDVGEHGDQDPSKIEVRGTITAAFQQTSAVLTVTPDGGGPDVGCAIVPGSLSLFAAGDTVKMECVRIGDTLKLKEIEKANGELQGDDEDDDDHGDDQDDDDGHDDDHGGDDD